jgi:hypothetical protein
MNICIKIKIKKIFYEGFCARPPAGARLSCSLVSINRIKFLIKNSADSGNFYARVQAGDYRAAN